jgi:superfamily II DNA/RNA helicase
LFSFQVVHYEVANDSETFVHRSGRTGRAGKAGTAILLYSFNQRRILDSLQRDLKCKFQSINPPSAKEVLMASAELAVEKLHKVHKDTIDAFLPTAEKLYSEQGTRAFAAALAHVSGFGEVIIIPVLPFF